MGPHGSDMVNSPVSGSKPTGEARRGGVLRELPTGHHLLRGEQLQAAGARPHPAVVMAWPGSGRSIAGDELGGGRSSGQLVRVAAVA